MTSRGIKYTNCPENQFTFTKVDISEHKNSVFVKLLVRQLLGLPDLFLRPCRCWKLPAVNC